MIFSSIFQKATSALTAYEQQLRQDAIDNPYRTGQHVAVYTTVDKHDFIAYGIVDYKLWDEDSGTYTYRIIVLQSPTVIEAFSYCMRPADASELRLLFMTIKGGKA